MIFAVSESFQLFLWSLMTYNGLLVSLKSFHLVFKQAQMLFELAVHMNLTTLASFPFLLFFHLMILFIFKILTWVCSLLSQILIASHSSFSAVLQHISSNVELRYIISFLQHMRYAFTNLWATLSCSRLLVQVVREFF